MPREPSEIVVGSGADGEPPPGGGRVGDHEDVEDGLLGAAEEGPHSAPLRRALCLLHHFDVEEFVP